MSFIRKNSKKIKKFDGPMMIVGTLILLVGFLITITKTAGTPYPYYFNGKYAFHVVYSDSAVFILSFPLIIFGCFIIYKSFNKKT